MCGSEATVLVSAVRLRNVMIRYLGPQLQAKPEPSISGTVASTTEADRDLGNPRYHSNNRTRARCTAGIRQSSVTASRSASPSWGHSSHPTGWVSTWAGNRPPHDRSIA